MSRYFSPHIKAMSGYLPGEQPRESGILKLNTNENPYPPSPRVAEAIRGALDGRLRLYPDPIGLSFREAVALRHGVLPGMVLAGNGSDDLLTILTRAIVSPGDLVVSASPSYILYRTLAELQNARMAEVPFETDWSLDPARFAALRPKIVFLANPNSPSGTAISSDQVAKIARVVECPLVVDEAYADFAENDCIGLVADHPNVIITRTLSKGSSLAGLRVGYLIAQADVVEGLVKVKDSYNCDTLSLLGGAAAIGDIEYWRETRSRIVATRLRLTEGVRSFGYAVPESQANFVWCTGGQPAGEVYQALRDRNILVRLMHYPGIEPGLRITVGTDEEIDRLLAAMRSILG